MTLDFIDEYRLIGTVFRDQKIMLTLWDSSNDCNLQDPPGLTFELGPDYVGVPDANFRNREVNHVLPFQESPSTGIAALAVLRRHPSSEMAASRTLIIPVKTLANFSLRIGTVERVPWQDWQQFATPTELRQAPSHTHILHSQVLSVRGADDSARSTSVLRVYDFSLRSRRRKVQDDPSALLPPYTVHEFQFDAAYHTSSFDFTEGGILVTSVRIFAILKDARVLTWLYIQHTMNEGEERHFWAI